MIDLFQDLSKTHELFKARLYFFSAFICSFIFYYFMTSINADHVDVFALRIVVAVLGLLGLIVTYIFPQNFRAIRFCLAAITIGYLGLYLYLLHLNQWSVFHRWSYFVVASILCSSALTWKDFFFNTIVGLLAPLLFLFSTPLAPLELIHFHSANLVTILLIGYSVHSHFKYKTEAALLSQSLIEKSKLAVLGEMAAGVSHEVNNPLAILNAAGDQLKKLVTSGQLEQKKLLDLIDKIDRMTLRITNIVKSLKDFSSEHSEVLNQDLHEKINLNETLIEILNSTQERFQISAIESQLNITDELLFISGNKKQISAAILNLLDNACEACRNELRPAIKISLIRQGNFAKITICDNGPGVPEELSSKIMQPFFTTKELGNGPGLGLSVTLGIAQKHQGKLFNDVEISASCFSLLLPILKTEDL